MFKRIFLYTTVMLLLTCVAAWGADWGRIMTPRNPLNVREDRSLSAKRVTTIMPGDEVRADFLDDGWYAVFRMDTEQRREDKALGYVKAGYLVPVGEWGELRTPRGMLNIRSKRSLSSEHVRTLRPGDVVRVDFEKDGWVAVFDPLEKERDPKKAFGYSNSKYLFPATAEQIEKAMNRGAAPQPDAAQAATENAPAENIPTAQAPEAPTQAEQAPEAATSSHWGRLVKVSRRVNLRADRTAASKLVATLEPGQAVRVDFLQKGWFAAFKIGETRRDEKHALGYIYAALIEEDLGALPAELSNPQRQPLPPAGANRPTTQGPGVDATAGPQIGPNSGPKADQVAPLYQVREPVNSGPPEELQEPAAAPARTETAAVEPEPAMPRQMVVDPAKAVEMQKGPVPVADLVRHGYRYALLDRQESREGRYPLDVYRVYLDVNVVPEAASLSDFCSTLWKEEWRQGTLFRVDVYLPGMDLKDLSYVEALFDGKGLRQFWTREAVLYGTRFKR